MTLQEAIERMAEELKIDIADGTVSEEHTEILLRLQKEIDKELAEKGYVENTLTPEELAMPVEEFLAKCLRRCSLN